MNRIHYYRRVVSSYLLRKNSQLSFWHEEPEINPDAVEDAVGPYYMTFAGKARYEGPFDDEGVPFLDYHGKIGRQYNPIAIAQYALANYNLAVKGETKRWDVFLTNARWLLNNRVANGKGLLLWPHHFDFEYFRLLKAPWFSGLAQGQGLSVLVRAYAETKDPAYLAAAEEVFRSLALPIEDGGVLHRDPEGYCWIEEYIVTPPTHILNGFIWALWGVHDYYLLTRSDEARGLFEACTKTIVDNLRRYDNGFWSLYEMTPLRFKNIASTYYHRLHIAQLEIMYHLTDEDRFRVYSAKWKAYQDRVFNRSAAQVFKVAFKLTHY
ncbi:MAG: D-glucuronyl C5-epimerase family protein [Pseudomonadota bacterium]